MTNLPETLFHEASKAAHGIEKFIFLPKSPPPSSENIFGGEDRADLG